MDKLVKTNTEVTKDKIEKVQGILNVEQMNFLLKETPSSHTHERPGRGGQTWKYVTGTYVKKVLNAAFGWNWSFEVDKFEMNIEAKQCIVLGKLTVISSGQTVVKMQFGRADIKFRKQTEIPLDLGNDLKAATTDALKKCASELGVASDIYGANEFKSVEVVNSVPSDEQLQYLTELIEICNLTDEEEKRVKFTLPSDTMRDVQKKIENLQDLLNSRSITEQYDLKLKLDK